MSNAEPIIKYTICAFPKSVSIYFFHFTVFNTSLLDSKVLSPYRSPIAINRMLNIGSLRVFLDDWKHVCTTFLINENLAGTSGSCVESIRHLEDEDYVKAMVVFGTNTITKENIVQFGIRNIKSYYEFVKFNTSKSVDFGLILVGLLK